MTWFPCRDNFIKQSSFSFTVGRENQHIGWLMSRAYRDRIRIHQCYLQGIYINHKEIRRSKFTLKTLLTPTQRCSPCHLSQQVIVVICDIKNIFVEESLKRSPRCNCFPTFPAVQCCVFLMSTSTDEGLEAITSFMRSSDHHFSGREARDKSWQSTFK